jgi:drug/metabolite transporter (DMT)-like permease
LPEGRAYVAWVVVCLVWGTTYLAIRIAIESLPPLLMSGIRWIIAGSILLLFFGIKGEVPLAPRAWFSASARGVLLIGLGNGSVVWAEQTVPSGLTSVFVAIAPFWLVGIDRLLGDGRQLGARQWTGLLIGFAGIVMLVSPELGSDLAGRSFLRGFIATQLACLGWAVGSIYARRSASETNDGTEPTAPAWEMLLGGLALTGVGLLSGERLGATVTLRSAAAVAYLIVFGSIVAFSAYRYALRHLPVATISLYVYVNTVIAVLLGTLVLNEPFSWLMGIGAGIVLTGIALVKQRRG